MCHEDLKLLQIGFAWQTLRPIGGWSHIAYTTNHPQAVSCALVLLFGIWPNYMRI